MAKAAFYTLGCKVNQTETAALQKLLETAGYQIVHHDDAADVYIINTCTVTHLSDRKSRQLLRRARRNNPDAVIVVTGCYAQVAADDVMKLPEVDLVVGTHGRLQLPALITQAKHTRMNCVSPFTEKSGFEDLAAAQSSERTRAFLKVQEGCRQFCTYCIVPYARGPIYSMPLQDAVQNAQRLADLGFRELVLTGVHLGSYGLDLAGEVALSDLLRALVPIKGISRIRISSLEPTEITPDLVDVMLEAEKVCHHLHLPLQSGDDYILRRMNRQYDGAEFLRLVFWLRSQIPDLALTTDVMVGFPGETAAQFENTLHVVRSAAFSRLHVFKYSPRRGTPAAKFIDQIPALVKDERSKRLIALGHELAATYQQRFIGKAVDVLFEEAAAHYGSLAGFTEHYVRVVANGSAGQQLGQIFPVHIKKSSLTGLQGQIIQK